MRVWDAQKQPAGVGIATQDVTVIYLGVFGICLVNSKLQEFKNDKNARNVLKYAMLSAYVCVLFTIFCAVIAGFKGV